MALSAVVMDFSESFDRIFEAPWLLLLVGCPALPALPCLHFKNKLLRRMRKTGWKIKNALLQLKASDYSPGIAIARYTATLTLLFTAELSTAAGTAECVGMVNVALIIFRKVKVILVTLTFLSGVPGRCVECDGRASLNEKLLCARRRDRMNQSNALNH